MSKTTDDALDWFVVRTNPNCEDRAVASIREAGFEAYKPERQKEYQHNRSKRWIKRSFPLFVGYVFLGMPAGLPQHFGRVRLCDGVKAILGSNPRDIHSRPISVPASMVAQLQELQAVGEFDDLRPLPFVPHDFLNGEAVTIGIDAFANLQGTVTDAAGKEQVKVLTELFASVREVKVQTKILKRIAA